MWEERDIGGDAEIARIYFIDKTSCWDMWCSAFLCLAGGFMAPLCCSRLKEARHSSTHQPFTCSLSSSAHTHYDLFGGVVDITDIARS